MHIDADGLFSTRDSSVLREFVEEYRSGERVWADHPEALFGSWESLPAMAQAAFRLLVEREISGTMRWFPHGPLWAGAVRRCWEADRYLAETSRFRPLRRQLIKGANRLSALPMNVRRRTLRLARVQRWLRGGRLSLGALLDVLGRDVHWLCGDFVEGVQVDERALGFHADARRRAIVGYHLGLDLMPTDEGLICLEGNLQSGFRSQHPSLQPHMPTVHGLIAAARAHGVTQIAWLEGHRKPVERWFMEAMTRLGAPHGVTTEFFQDPRVPSRRDLPGVTSRDLPRRSWLCPIPSGTLVVRRNEFPVGSDYLVNHKETFVRALHAVLSCQRRAPVHVLPHTRHAEIAPGSFDHGLPNIVYKYPDGLAGEGVFFMRVRTADDAHRIARDLDARTGEPPGVFQRFVSPQPSASGSVKDYRTEILITPLGSWFLGAVRRVAAPRMLTHVPEGLIDAPGVFTSNRMTGGVLESVDDEELAMLEPASLSVGDALRDVLARTFVTGDVLRPGNECASPSGMATGSW